jgi:hypothetical protein
MKKFLLLVAGAFMLSTSSWAWELVPFTVNYEDEKPIGHSTPKSPIEPPLVYIEDYTLSFGINHPEYALIIKDENDSVVFTTTVFSTQSDVILPSSLSGIYEIELVMDNWLFCGWINL